METGLVYGAGLTWDPTQLTSLSLEGEGGFDSSDVGASNLTHQIALRVDHELLRNVLIGGRSGTSATNSRTTLARSTATPSVRTSAYLINRYLSIGSAIPTRPGITMTTLASSNAT